MYTLLDPADLHLQFPSGHRRKRRIPASRLPGSFLRGGRQASGIPAKSFRRRFGHTEVGQTLKTELKETYKGFSNVMTSQNPTLPRRSAVSEGLSG